MTRWNHNHPVELEVETSGDNAWIELRVAGDTPTGALIHTFALQAAPTSGKQTFGEYLLKRLACHVVIDCLPDEAFDEVLPTLSDAIEFYRSRTSRPLLASDEPTPKQIVLRSFENRPAFVATED
jgi:hypothetical protein